MKEENLKGIILSFVFLLNVIGKPILMGREKIISNIVKGISIKLIVRDLKLHHYNFFLSLR